MTTFDASAMIGPADSVEPTPPPPTVNGAPAETFDALSMLREQVAERDDGEDDLCPIEVPGLGWRLMCDITFPYSKFAAWQTAALPKNQRNGRKVNMLKLDQTGLAFSVLLGTCVELQYERVPGSGDWETLVASDGTPLLPTSDALLRTFNVVDPRSFLRSIYGREARLVEASQRVAAKAGWLEDDEDDDDADPTV